MAISLLLAVPSSLQSSVSSYTNRCRSTDWWYVDWTRAADSLSRQQIWCFEDESKCK